MSEEINYKKFIPIGIQTVLAIPSIYDLALFFIFPERWFKNQMGKKDSTFTSVCTIFLGLRLLKKYLIYYLLFHLIFFIITFMLCKNNYTITSYLMACIVCSIQAVYIYFYNFVVDTANNDPTVKEMNKSLNELDKEEFKKHFNDGKHVLTKQQKSMVNILLNGKEKTKDEDYKEIIKLLLDAEEEIDIKI